MFSLPSWRGVMVSFLAGLALTLMTGCESFFCPPRVETEPAEPVVIEEPKEPDCIEQMPLLLERVGPEKVRKGQNYEYKLMVTNRACDRMRNVTIAENLPDGLTFVGATPQPASQSPLQWKFDDLDSNETRTIRIQAKATETGDLSSCAKATHELQKCAPIRVVQPALTLQKTAPEKVLLCDDIPVEFNVSNTGTGMAKGVTIEEELPKGLVTLDGKRKVVLDVGDLPEDSSETIKLTVKADRTGTFDNTAKAHSTGGLSVDSNTTTTVVQQPILSVAKSGPSKKFLGQQFTYTITVKNTGDAPAKGTVLTDRIPDNTKFIRASDNGAFGGNSITWDVGTIQPNGSREVEVVLQAAGIAAITNSVTAEADCAEEDSDSVRTELAGIPALLLEVVDLSDPVEVGDTTIYEITVTNQGSLAAENVEIVVELEDEMEYVSSDGPTTSSIEADTITFEPLASIDVGEKVTWALKVKALDAGDIRLKVEMTSDMLTRPVNETEATHIYK